MVGLFVRYPFVNIKRFCVGLVLVLCSSVCCLCRECR